MKRRLVILVVMIALGGMAMITTEQLTGQLLIRPAQSSSPAIKDNIETVLNSFHKAAAEARWDHYFSLMTKDAIFIGTDASERWPRPIFESYARPTNGWVYTLRKRHIHISKDQNTAWFDEILDSKTYGTSRGSGVLVRQDSDWKIAQYHLTFPIPNDLADKFTQQIQAFERHSENK